VIGTGSIAKRHIRNLRSLYPKANIVCVSSSGRKITASDVGATSTSNSIEDAILKKPDFAIIASPSNFHLIHASKFIILKIPILIEKPISANYAELSKFKFDRKKDKIAVGYNLRFMPSAKSVKQIIESNALGKISTVSAEVGQYLPDWRPGSDYRKGVSAQKKLGGGALLELSHELDYLNWLFGRFTEVFAITSNSKILEIDVEDNVDALMTNKNGTIFHLHLDFLQRSPCRYFKAVGEKGTLTWNLLNNEVSFHECQGTSKVIYSNPYYDWNEMYLDQLRTFELFTKGQADFESGINSSIEVMRLIEAIRLSNSQRSWVNLEEII
jgi:predicted dehydrogenase